MCDDSSLRQPPAGESRGPKDRLRRDELSQFAPRHEGICLAPAGGVSAAPAIMVVCPARYGLVQHTVDVAARFAQAGYLAVSPDFYESMATESVEERLPDLSDDVILAHMEAALGYAVAQGGDGTRVGVFGVCRSGSWGLLASAAQPQVRAVIMMYGGAQSREFEVGERRTRPYEETISASSAPVLGVYGEKDHTMSVGDVVRLRNTFESAGRSYDIRVLPDLPHGWLNDTMPGRYRAAEAEDTWAVMLSFLRRELDQPTTRSVVNWSFAVSRAADYDFLKNRREE